jgi:hypothetical protein
MLVLDLTSGETLGRVEVQNSPDGVTYSRVQRPLSFGEAAPISRRRDARDLHVENVKRLVSREGR